MDFNELAELLYPHITTVPDDMEKRFPPRILPEGAKVTRIAPSPTGFMHLGNLFGAITDERLAHQSGGVFLLRIEDTDAKREVEGGVEKIIDAFTRFGLKFDEGATLDGDFGDYGPYRQSDRVEIYQTYAKQLVREGKAYPCFCTEKELEDIRLLQQEQKADYGYYGRWAVWRGADMDAIKAKLKDSVPFVLRFRSEGSIDNKYKFTDLIKGTVEITENDKDHIIIKSDGIPPYAFAHPVDDHLMRVTHVVRGEEWLPSLPFHLQLFKALGFRIPKYCHTAQLLKLDNGNKRKLSKRLDPELALEFYHAEGYPVPCVIEYLMTLLNSNFEEWRMANPFESIDKFKFTTNKMSVSGALFDLNKLTDVSKNTIARMSADEVFKGVTQWAEKYDVDFAERLNKDPDYAVRILSIGRGGTKPRKDFATWADVKPYVSLFYDDYYQTEDVYPGEFDRSDIKKALELFIETYDEADDSVQWFSKIKSIADTIGYAPETKLYKKNPDAYKGHVGDISMFIRIAVTGRLNSPDLYEVMHILGRHRTIERINKQLTGFS
ncbi:MAG: glutamate--tRNA ligase [Eubacteriales bacterium]|nr:glutamate--tRNA ligase [Eubacteriales bacterium]